MSLLNRSTGHPRDLSPDLAVNHHYTAPRQGNMRVRNVGGAGRKLEAHARLRDCNFRDGRGVTFSVRGGA